MRTLHDIADAAINGGQGPDPDETLDLCRMALAGEQALEKLDALIDALADDGLKVLNVTTDDDEHERLLIVPLDEGERAPGDSSLTI